MLLHFASARSYLVSCFAVAFLLFAPGVSSGAQASSQTFEELHARLSEALVPRLEQLAAECRKARLFGVSDGLHEIILGCDGENAAARRALGYHRISTTEWVRSKAYKRRRDHGDAEELTAMQARIEAELASYRQSLLNQVDRVREQEGLARAWEALERLGECLPEDEIVRDLLGEERVGDHWELIESVRARKRRTAYPSLARACLARAPQPEVGEVRPEERALPLVWNAARRTRDVRVLGTTGDSEVTHATRVSHAVGDFVRYTLRVEDRHREDFTIYLLGLAERASLLQSWPQLSEQTRNALFQADGGWLDSGHRLAEWSANPARRIDGAARQTLGTLMIDAFGIDGRQGWAWEGVGLYLVHELVGTRLTWFFHPDGYAPQGPTGLWMRLQAPESDWLQEGALLLDGPDAPSLVYLLGRKINDMREQDVLHAYVLAAYLMEGFPQEVPVLLRRIGAGQHPTTVFEEELGFPLPTIERRLRHWLTESRAD